MYQTNNQPNYKAFIFILITVALCIVSSGCELGNAPYREGYQYGHRIGEIHRNLGVDCSVSGAKDSAAQYQYMLKQSNKGYIIGTPEYGNFMCGVEDGYYAGYR